MGRSLALLLAALHLAAASLPCPPADGASERDARALHAAGALHATHAVEAERGAPLDLRAPCPCGCRHAPSAAPAARLGPALLAAAPRPAPLPGASALVAFEPGAARARAAVPDPVPRA